MKLSILIPVYNELSTVEKLVNKVLSTPFETETEIIIVDDASNDGTREVLSKISDARVKVIYHSKNQGKGAAIKTAIKNATGDYIIIQDADLEYDPSDINKLICKAKEGFDVIYGSRFYYGMPNGDNIIHYLGNRLLTQISNLFSGLKLSDMETCYKMIKREILNKIKIEENGFGIEPEITAKIAKHRFSITEVPISYKPRNYSEGKKIGLKDLLRTIYCIFKYNLK
ncbi:MAG: glycosyltransferase family 2 protein [Deltaproteobacteria bacterium]|nr:glycosyltransferase family 2 protein [Deltaproteobacteria bacterium]